MKSQPHSALEPNPTRRSSTPYVIAAGVAALALATSLNPNARSAIHNTIFPEAKTSATLAASEKAAALQLAKDRALEIIDGIQRLHPETKDTSHETFVQKDTAMDLELLDSNKSPDYKYYDTLGIHKSGKGVVIKKEHVSDVTSDKQTPYVSNLALYFENDTKTVPDLSTKAVNAYLHDSNTHMRAFESGDASITYHVSVPETGPATLERTKGSDTGLNEPMFELSYDDVNDDPAENFAKFIQQELEP